MKNVFKELSVLLIDPFWEEAEQTKKLLRNVNEYDISINHLHDYENVLESVEHISPDLIFLEHESEDGTALSLAREIRTNHFSIPIIVLSNGGSEHICAKYFRIGVDDYRVKKQLDPDILHTAIKYALTSRSKMVEQKHAAKFDELTNLYNRRFSLRRIKQEMTHAVRHDLPFTLCILDLDGFKQINDEHGHLSGDYLLKRVAEMIRESVRSGDIVGRYGGDEFLLGFRNTDSSGAYRAAKKLTDEISDTVFHLPSGEHTNVTCSIGLAGFRGDEYSYDDQIESVETFLDRADKALYNAKEKGEGVVERRRHERHTLDNPVPMELRSGSDRESATLENYSSSGVRLGEGPELQEGQQITLLFDTSNGSRVERQGTIRSCQQQQNSTKAMLGIEVEHRVPEEVIEEELLAGEQAS